MNEQENLIKLVVLADAELDRTCDVREALIRLQIIRAKMIKAGVDDKTLNELAIVVATMQPFLIHPDFMHIGDADG